MYCTREDLNNTFGAAVIDDLLYDRPAALDAAITDATALIDSYIGARYSLPLAEVPPVLVSSARDLVRYALDMDPDEAITARRAAAIRYLESLAQGRATLGVPQASEPVSLDTVEIESDGHIFSRRNSKGFL